MKKFEEEFNYLIELSGKVLTGQIEAEKFEKHRAIFLNEYGQKQKPEIPEFVAEYLKRSKFRHKGVRFSLVGALKCTDFIDDKTRKWLEDWHNQEIFAQAWLNGYTVAKEKRFYLKHIDMSKKYNSNVCVLAHGDGDVIYGHYEFPVGVFPSESDYIFTQKQIDSMETGSYKQIGVEE